MFSHPPRPLPAPFPLRSLRSGKVLPVDRGRGVHQPSMRVATELLARGDWLHVFPEARVVFDGRMGPLRWGVGHLLCNAVAMQSASAPYPVVLPFFHSGMGRVMPRNAKVPRVRGAETERPHPFPFHMSLSLMIYPLLSRCFPALY